MLLSAIGAYACSLEPASRPQPHGGTNHGRHPDEDRRAIRVVSRVSTWRPPGVVIDGCVAGSHTARKGI